MLSADALQRLVHRQVQAAGTTCASLQGRRITPHTLRRSVAMALLQHGVDPAVIALWLGHESIETTQLYLHADMQLKERALGYSDPAGNPPDPVPARGQPPCLAESTLIMPTPSPPRIRDPTESWRVSFQYSSRLSF